MPGNCLIRTLLESAMESAVFILWVSMRTDIFWNIAAVYRSREYLTEAQKHLVELMKELRIAEMR